MIPSFGPGLEQLCDHFFGSPVMNESAEGDEDAGDEDGAEAATGASTGYSNGGGKNDKHANPDKRKAAEDKWKAAKEELERAKRDGLSKKIKKQIQKTNRSLG